MFNYIKLNLKFRGKKNFFQWNVSEFWRKKFFLEGVKNFSEFMYKICDELKTAKIEFFRGVGKIAVKIKPTLLFCKKKKNFRTSVTIIINNCGKTCNFSGNLPFSWQNVEWVLKSETKNLTKVNTNYNKCDNYNDYIALKKKKKFRDSLELTP